MRAAYRRSLLILQRRVSKLDSVAELTSVETSRREPSLCAESCTKYKTCNVSVATDITILVVILVIDVLIVVIEHCIRSAAQLVEELNRAVNDNVGVGLTDDVST